MLLLFGDSCAAIMIGCTKEILRRAVSFSHLLTAE